MRRGIPTRYAGLVFRSRVEARWAAMFDQLGWRWEYEPLDLDGYIPDFVLKFHKPLLVEVKHEFSTSCMVRYCRKIEMSGWEHEAIILGATPELPEDALDRQSLGLLGERCYGPDDDDDAPSDWWWGEAVPIYCRVCDRPSFCHNEANYACRATGCHDGDRHMRELPEHFLTKCWHEAHEHTAWRGAA